MNNLESLVHEIAVLKSKLILLIGPPGNGKTVVLHQLANSRNLTPLSVGFELGTRLAMVPHKHRNLEASNILRELTDQHAKDNLLLIDNIELLFDIKLKLDPLELLRRIARTRCVVATWPGELRNGRLEYAEIGHPEYQDYSIECVVPFEIQ